MAIKLHKDLLASINGNHNVEITNSSSIKLVTLDDLLLRLKEFETTSKEEGEKDDRDLRPDKGENS